MSCLTFPRVSFLNFNPRLSQGVARVMIIFAFLLDHVTLVLSFFFPLLSLSSGSHRSRSFSCFFDKIASRRKLRRNTDNKALCDFLFKSHIAYIAEKLEERAVLVQGER